MPERYHDSPRGTNFDPETGKLYVFTPDSVTVMRGWPQPLAWRKRRSRRPQWTHVRPVISVSAGDLGPWIRDLEEDRVTFTGTVDDFLTPQEKAGFRLRDLALLRWEDRIPREIRDLIAPVPQRQWHLLSFLARCGPAAADLTASDPALAWMLASNWAFHRPAVRQPLRSARALLRRGRRRREILVWLGFPGTEAACHVLRKVSPRALDVPTLLYLRDSLADPGVRKLLAHAPRLNREALRIVTDPELRPRVTASFLADLSERPDHGLRPEVARQLRDCVAMHRLVAPGGREPAPFRSYVQLGARHDELAAALGRPGADGLDFGLDLDAPFPTPPVQGSQVILPLTTARQLLAEGREQHNCAASYVERVARQQRAYVYRVLWPERCTLALERQGERWVPGDLRRAANEPVSDATRRVVAEWLAARRAG